MKHNHMKLFRSPEKKNSQGRWGGLGGRPLDPPLQASETLLVVVTDHVVTARLLAAYSPGSWRRARCIAPIQRRAEIGQCNDPYCCWTSPWCTALWSANMAVVLFLLSAYLALLCRFTNVLLPVSHDLDSFYSCYGLYYSNTFTNSHAYHSDVFIPPSVTLTADRRLLFAAGLPIYRPSVFKSKQSIITALLLLVGNIEPNPDPYLKPSSKKLQLNFGLLNTWSAVNKAALIHDVIADYKLDLVVVTETWITSDVPNVVRLNIVPDGYRVISWFLQRQAWRWHCI